MIHMGYNTPEPFPERSQVRGKEPLALLNAEQST